MRAPPRHSSEERGPPGRRAPQPGFIPNRNTFFADPVEEWKLLVRSRLANGVVADPARPLLTLRVTVGFVVLAALIGAPRGPAGALATLVILASVLLVHELSRALVAIAFGRSSSVVISASGGRTEVLGTPFRGVEAASFATIGSAANAVVAIASVGITRIGAPHEAAGLLRALAFSHAVWAGAQLLPIIPFRAGITIASGLSPSARFAHAAASCAVLAAAFVFVGGWLKAPLLLAVLALSAMASVNLVRDAYRESSDADSRVGATALDAEARLSEGASEKAAELAEQGLAVALSARARERLYRALAWAQIGRRNPFRAHAALLQLPAHAIDLHLLAAYLSCCNRADEAVALLQEARGVGHRSPETTKLLADLLFRRGERHAVRALATSDAGILSAEDRTAIEAALSGYGSDGRRHAQGSMQ